LRNTAVSLTAILFFAGCAGEERDPAQEKIAIENLLAAASPYDSTEDRIGDQTDPIHGFFRFAQPPGFEARVRRDRAMVTVQPGTPCSGERVPRSWIQFTQQKAEISVITRKTYCADSEDVQADVELMVENLRGTAKVEEVRYLDFHGAPAGEVLAVISRSNRRLHAVKFRKHGLDHSIILYCPAGTYHRYQGIFLDFLRGYRSIEPQPPPAT
jgi:hypothetical protein